MSIDAIRLVVDAVPAMLAYWDSSQRCVFANRAYLRWFGITPDALIGKTMKDLLGPIYPLNLPYIEGALRGERQEFEREIPDPLGGPPRHSLAVYIPNIENGKVLGFSVLVSEITAQKKTEAALRDALAQVKTLSGLLPVCAWCRRIRDDKGYWTSLERYVVEHSDATLSHGICETCAAERFPDDSERGGD
ncbi:MAG TPA: PAS domain-containing protein [bacterium]|nr:PAS domain-containing protein [bacterium]